jgi:hypothetical protein
MELQHKAEMIRVLDTRIAAGTFDGRAVLLFGHCNATEEMADYLLSRGVTPVLILDNSEAKQGQTYRGIPITPPENVLKYTSENSVVLIATRFFAEMSAQLRRLGYDGEIVQVVEYNSFAEYSLSDDTLRRKTARMTRGVETLKNVRAQYPSQHLIICPNSALGDVYWAMAFLPEYRAKRCMGEVVAVVAGDGCRQVAEMFGAGQIVTLSPTEMDEFTQAVIYTREDNCLFAHHDRPYTDNIIKYLDKYFLSFIDYYRCAVYSLPPETEPAAPAYLQPYGGDATLQHGNSVILAPCAKSVTRMPAGFWENIASEWRGKGAEVCTSIYGGETPVRGTAPLTLPLNQMTAAAEYAGVFVGLRSGLCDVVNSANCRKIVVFPDCFYSSTPHKVADFFALPGWESVVR